jgi:hypothetical protein
VAIVKDCKGWQNGKGMVGMVGLPKRGNFVSTCPDATLIPSLVWPSTLYGAASSNFWSDFAFYYSVVADSTGNGMAPKIAPFSYIIDRVEDSKIQYC